MLRTAVVAMICFTVLTGLVYPLAMTGAAQLLFPRQANGSLVERDGIVVGSVLIGQAFTAPAYFWSRPSTTGPAPYNGAASSGSNHGATAPALLEAVGERVAALRAADPGNTQPVPVDLVTASGSGLDPHISPAATTYQVERVARARGIDPDVVRALIARHTEGQTFGVLGEQRVNVLLLNLALDSLAPVAARTEGGVP
ncbi:MAG: potassium-transporting ATPase subunit KdpC [Gemmatimonadales bacterium]